MLFDCNGYNAEFNVFKSWYYANKVRKECCPGSVVYTVDVKGGVFYRLYELKEMKQISFSD